jgi:mono/diheme cytochrome c family protein
MEGRLTVRTILFFALAILAGSGAIAASNSSSAEDSAFDPEVFYDNRCAFCHAEGGWGTRTLAKRWPGDEAELLKRENLPPPLTIAVVRRGIGSMPQFTPTELTDTELAELAQWLEDRN